MDRRSFIKTSAALGITAAIPGGLTGCSGNQVANILNTVIASAEAVAKVIDPSAKWYPAFIAAVTALQNAEASWKSGSPATIVVEALNTLAAVTTAIPLTAAYAPLIAILVAGIDAVITALSTSNSVPPVVATGAAMAHASMLASNNPYVGRTHLVKHFYETHTFAYRMQWNSEVLRNITLAPARI